MRLDGHARLPLGRAASPPCGPRGWPGEQCAPWSVGLGVRVRVGVRVRDGLTLPNRSPNRALVGACAAPSATCGPLMREPACGMRACDVDARLAIAERFLGGASFGPPEDVLLLPPALRRLFWAVRLFSFLALCSSKESLFDAAEQHALQHFFGSAARGSMMRCGSTRRCGVAMLLSAAAGYLCHPGREARPGRYRQSESVSLCRRVLPSSTRSGPTGSWRREGIATLPRLSHGPQGPPLAAGVRGGAAASSRTAPATIAWP